MKQRLVFDEKPRFTAKDAASFSHGDYDCRFLLQDRKGLPVAVSQKNDPDCQVWQIMYGSSCVVFGNYEDAMAFCRERFYDLSGAKLSEQETEHHAAQ